MLAGFYSPPNKRVMPTCPQAVAALGGNASPPALFRAGRRAAPGGPFRHWAHLDSVFGKDGALRRPRP